MIGSLLFHNWILLLPVGAPQFVTICPLDFEPTNLAQMRTMVLEYFFYIYPKNTAQQHHGASGYSYCSQHHGSVKNPGRSATVAASEPDWLSLTGDDVGDRPGGCGDRGATNDSDRRGG